MVDKT
jgi:hypothetical protein